MLLFRFASLQWEECKAEFEEAFQELIPEPEGIDESSFFKSGLPNKT
jgi:hypothetical protein